MDIARVAELYDQGNKAYEQGEWSRARELYSEALEAAEKAGADNVLLSHLWSNRSAAFASLEDFDAALVDAEKTISIRGDWARGYARKAVALMGLKRFEEATEINNEGRKCDPEDEMLKELDQVITLQKIIHQRETAAQDNALADAVNTIRESNIESSLPVVVLSGFLGSGKTTLLNHILTNHDSQKRIALLVNDMAEINIDSEMIRNVHEVTETSEELIELTNGCVCCTLRGDLIKAATQIICSKKFDLMVIEATGISEPMPVAATFTTKDINGLSLEEFFTIDNMVTLVDCSRFLEELKNGESLKQKNMAAHEGDARHVSQLLIEQVTVEFANTILLNKCDLVSKEQILQVKGFVHEINPLGCILESIQSKVDLSQILDTKRFSVDWANEMEGFKTELINPHTSETEEYGIGSVVFRSRIPFHPQRLMAFFFGPGEVTVFDRIADESPLKDIYRSKGMFYLAPKFDEKLSWSTAGRNVVFQLLGRWQASILPQEKWPAAGEEWDSTWGDREQKIVLIGNKEQLQRILQSLEACLLTQEEQELPAEAWVERDPEGQENSDHETKSD